MPERHKRPESVLVVVFTVPGEALLLRRVSPVGFWQSVTGSLEPREGPRDAAIREIREETGLGRSAGALMDLRHTERFPILPAWRRRYAPGVHYNLEHWFALALPGRRLIRLNEGEHVAYAWMTFGRAASLATSWTNRKAILGIAQLLRCA